MANFKLWLEFENAGIGDWDITNEFCNINVHLPDGRQYGINVWTYKFVETAFKLDAVSGENLHGLYLKPPDLLVKELTRECIEQVINHLLDSGIPLEQSLNPSVIGNKHK